MKPFGAFLGVHTVQSVRTVSLAGNPQAVERELREDRGDLLRAVAAAGLVPLVHPGAHSDQAERDDARVEVGAEGALRDAALEHVEEGAIERVAFGLTASNPSPVR